MPNINLLEFRMAGIYNKNDQSYKNEDVYKMHTYKDAINNTEGAYVIYPGDKDVEIFKEKEKLIPSVGAFPLTPGNSKEQEEELRLDIV